MSIANDELWLARQFCIDQSGIQCTRMSYTSAPINNAPQSDSPGAIARRTPMARVAHSSCSIRYETFAIHRVWLASILLCSFRVESVTRRRISHHTPVNSRSSPRTRNGRLQARPSTRPRPRSNICSLLRRSSYLSAFFGRRMDSQKLKRVIQ